MATCYYKYKVGGQRFRLRKTARKHARRTGSTVTSICEGRRLGRLSGATKATKAVATKSVTTKSKAKAPAKAAPGARSEVHSPTRTEVRSPTSTSTEAETRGNVTVTGGAGRGATTSVTIYGGMPNTDGCKVTASKRTKKMKGLGNCGCSTPLKAK